MVRTPLLPAFLVLALLACQPMGQGQSGAVRYLVTDTPLDVGVGPGLCVAVDPSDEHGVWWWEPGATGCSTRSTGPGVFPANRAVVPRPTPGAALAVTFRVGTHSTTRPFVDVRLAVGGGSMRALETGARARLVRRPDLDVQEKPGPVRR